MYFPFNVFLSKINADVYEDKIEVFTSLLTALIIIFEESLSVVS